MKIFFNFIAISLATSTPAVLGGNGVGGIVWHASVVVMGKEYQYGKYGVLERLACSVFGDWQPTEIIPMGRTSMQLDIVLKDFIEMYRNGVYQGILYNFDIKNSMHFADQLLSLLVYKNVPQQYFGRPENSQLREKQELMDKIANFQPPPADNSHQEKNGH